MKLLQLLIPTVLLMSCGSPVDLRTKPKHKPTVPKDYIVVGTTKITISNSEGTYAVSPVNANVTYVEPEVGKFDTTASIVASADGEDAISLGSVVVDTININKLKVCGGGSDKCTSSIIRIYTTPVTGHPGISGFVNTTTGEGIPFLADGVSVGLDTGGATTVDSYTIPANDNKLRNGDFTDLTYTLGVDTSNAEAGDYELDLVLELLLGS